MNDWWCGRTLKIAAFQILWVHEQRPNHLPTFQCARHVCVEIYVPGILCILNLKCQKHTNRASHQQQLTTTMASKNSTVACTNCYMSRQSSETVMNMVVSDEEQEEREAKADQTQTKRSGYNPIGTDHAVFVSNCQTLWSTQFSQGSNFGMPKSTPTTAVMSTLSVVAAWINTTFRNRTTASGGQKQLL